jgi:hypothetical protein
VAILEVRWNEDDGQPVDDYTFFYGNGNANHHFETDFFVHQGIRSAVKRQFVSCRMPYLILRGCWCVVVLNMLAPSEDKVMIQRIACI